MTVNETPTPSVIGLTFNIMPDRGVSERLLIHHCHVTPECIECHFDREYESSMAASPTHLTMIVYPLLIQRLTYIYCCTRLKLPYLPNGPELLKIWPDRVEQYFPRMLRRETGLICRMNVVEFKTIEAKRHYMAIEATVNQTLTCKASAGIFVT